jgi:hypothetical protein
VDVEEIWWELQETLTTRGGEFSSWFYDWSPRCHLLDILEGPATTQAQEGGADSVGTGSIGASVHLVLKKNKKKGLVHGNGSHLIKGPLQTTSLKEGAAGTLGCLPTNSKKFRFSIGPSQCYIKKATESRVSLSLRHLVFEVILCQSVSGISA